MKNKADNIRRYDDAMLKREPAIRIMRFLAGAILGLFLVSTLILAPTGYFQDRMSLLIAPLAALLVVCGALESSLRHIASIKLYRKEEEESQHPLGT